MARIAALGTVIALMGLALFAFGDIVVFPDARSTMTFGFLLLTAYSMGAGLTGLAFMDIMAKVIPPTRRGAFFAQRAFWGGLLALAVLPFMALTTMSFSVRIRDAARRRRLVVVQRDDLASEAALGLVGVE